MGLMTKTKPGCPVVSELTIMQLASGALPDKEVKALLPHLAQFHSLYERWSEYAVHFEQEKKIPEGSTEVMRERIRSAKDALPKNE